MKNTVPWTDHISDIKREEVVSPFYDRKLLKTDNLEMKK